MELIKNDNLWFGNYGGCFVADAFSLHCDNYYKQFAKLVKSQKFNDNFKALKDEFKPQFKMLDEHTILIPENYYSVLGTALIYKSLDKKQALVACRYVDEALFIAKTCKKLGINLKMYLTKELSGISTLVDQLKLNGIEVITKNCIELINHPEMYVFQEWLAESDDKHIINSRCNVGAFPQVNVASYFIKQFKEDFDFFLKENGLDFNKIAIPVISGTSALGIMDENHSYITYECDDQKDTIEELDSFCGTFTKVIRNNYTDRVLCPELVDKWEKENVIRKQVNIEDVDFAYNTYGIDLSLQSLALLSKENDKNVLRVVKSLRFGTNL